MHRMMQTKCNTHANKHVFHRNIELHFVRQEKKKIAHFLLAFRNTVEVCVGTWLWISMSDVNPSIKGTGTHSC